MSNTFYDAVRFTAASAGTGDFVVNTAVQGFRTPAAAGVPNSANVSLRAESSDLSEWEESQSVYTSSGTSFTRVVTANHLGTTAKVNFTAPPQVAIVLASSDIVDAGKFSSGTVPAARLPASTTAAQGAIQLATTSDQGTGTATNRAVTPGVQQAHPSAAKAWVQFNGTGTVAIRSSFNVSSVTDNGTGKYTLNFTNAMADANYMVTGTGANSGNHGIHAMESNNGSAYTDKTTTEVQLTFAAENTGGVLDCFSINVVIFD